ncbi:stAR-related lipid transfer protein 3-like [Rhinophrynus dorsalis]
MSNKFAVLNDYNTNAEFSSISSEIGRLDKLISEEEEKLRRGNKYPLSSDIEIVKETTQNGFMENAKVDVIEFSLLIMIRLMLFFLGYLIPRLRHWSLIVIITLITSGYVILMIVLSEVLPRGVYCAIIPISIIILDVLEAWLLIYQLRSQKKEEENELEEVVVDRPTSVSFKPSSTECSAVDLEKEQHQYPVPNKENGYTTAPEFIEGELEEVLVNCTTDVSTKESSTESSAGDLEDFEVLDGADAPPEATAATKEPSKVINDVWKEQVLTGMSFLKKVLSLQKSWNLKNKEKNGDIVYMLDDPEYGHVHIVQASMKCSAEAIYRHTIQEPEMTGTFQSSLKNFHILEKVDDNISITYHIVEQQLIASRDFVNIRCVENTNGDYMCSFMPTTYAAKPPTGEYMRDVNGPWGFAFMQCPNDPNSGTFYFVISAKMDSKMIQYLVDKTIRTSMLGVVSELSSKV